MIDARWFLPLLALGGAGLAVMTPTGAVPIKPLHVFHAIPGDICFWHTPKHGRRYANCRPTPIPVVTTTTVAKPPSVIPIPISTTTIPITTTTKAPVVTTTIPVTTTSQAPATTTTEPSTTTTLPIPSTSTTTTTAPSPTTTTVPVATTTTQPSGGPFNVSPTSQWAGYLGSGSSSTATGSWTVPKMACSGTEALGSTWLGVGGWDGSTLLQIGTFDQCIGGQEQHGAFIEEYPGTEANIPLVFSPGATVTVSLTRQSATTWAWSINGVTGTAAYTGGGVASWITEAFGTSGSVPLPVNDATMFSGLTVNGAPALITSGFSMAHLTPSAPPTYRLTYA